MRGVKLIFRSFVCVTFFLLAAFVWGPPAQANNASWDVDFTTHARTYALAGRTELVQASTEEIQSSDFYLLIQRLRPALSVWWDDWLGVELAYDFAPMFSSNRGAASLSELALSTRRTLRLVDFGPELVESSDGNWRLRHNLDRLNIRIGHAGLEAQIGRQAINHGSARMFPATDFFAPFGPEAIDAEFKQGVDAIRLTAGMNEFHELEFYMVLNEETLDDGAEPEDWMYLGRWRAIFPELLDLSLLAGFSYGRLTLGLDVSMELMGAAVYAETSARLKGQSHETTAARTTLGVDYYWDFGLQTLLEVHYSSPGSSRSEDTLAGLSTEHQIGEVNLLGQWYLGMSTAYVWRLFKFAVGGIMNLQDMSALLTMKVGYEAMESVSLGLGGMLPLGDTPRQEVAAFEEGVGIGFDDLNCISYI